MKITTIGIDLAKNVLQLHSTSKSFTFAPWLNGPARFAEKFSKAWA